MKKILALLISVALLFSMVVVPVSAEDDVTYISEKKNVLFADVNEKLEFSDIFVKVKKYVINAENFTFSCADDAVTVDADITDASLKNMVSGGNLHVTAVGQSATSTVKQLLKNAGWYITEEAEGAANVKGTYTINNTLAASGINAGDTVIIILGTSGKGLGAAGVSQADELARAQAIVAKEGVKVIAIHTGGKGYRGESSDPIIEAVVPHADVA